MNCLQLLRCHAPQCRLSCQLRSAAPSTSAPVRGSLSARRPAWRVASTATRRTCVCTASSETQQSGAPVVDAGKLFEELADACAELKQAPPSMKYAASADVKDAMDALKAAGALLKWGKVFDDGLVRRNVFLGDLRQVGVKDPEKVAVPSVRNDAAFLYTLVGVTSVLAVLGGQLPGDWGFFVPYLTGAIVLVVLAVGSTAPGLLQVFTDKFQTIFPDYRERVLKHEAGHFLIAYLLGVPITGYSLDISKEHVSFAEASLQKRLIERKLTDDEINQMSIMCMSGVSAEAQAYDEVVGQTQDLMDLQRILRRSETKLGDQAQQNLTRWAVFQASSALRKHQPEYEALMAAMQRGASVADCIQAIEAA